MHLRPTETVSTIKELISTFSGIQSPNIRLFYQNKPICDTVSISTIPNDANIVAMLPILGGITPCDMCYYEPGNYSCSDCGQVYCKDCSIKVHKHPQRQHHTPEFIPESDTVCESNEMPLDSHNISISSQLSDSDYGFNNSPSTSLLLEQATMSMTLSEKFNMTRFRDYQKKAITAILDGKDCLIIQPTGSGKSLCFQFPPIYQNKKAIVITPTISLMKDQVTNCREKGIHAVFLGSAQLDKSLEDHALLPDSSESIIFVTPEWISKSPNKEKVQHLVRHKLSLIAIDEAHLFHMWPQFRTSYQQLETLKSDFPTVPLIALTATAPLDVQQSIQKLLQTPLLIKGSVNRPNIFLSCEELPFSGGKGLSHFAARVSEILDGSSAIIYTDFIDNIGPIVSELSEYDIDCVAYHGEMDIQSRHTSYSKW